MNTLLVVDDVPANLAMLTDAATAAGFRVLLAEDGERALRLAERAQPDLVLLDVLMPGLDGIATCRRLKANPATREIPVIFVTALGETVDKVAGLAAGAVDYVTKPLQPPEVLARVCVHLELRQVRAKLQEEVARRAEAERALRHSLDRAVLVATLDGELLFSTIRAARLIARHFSTAELETLPDELLAFVKAGPGEPTRELSTAVGSLRVRRFAETCDAECATLLLEEIAAPGALLQRQFGLSPREAEVLFWIAQGKSNPEIAIILANTTGTVKKQVSSILEKVGTENRLTAAKLANEALAIGHM